MKKNIRGFTLIEISIVLVAISSLVVLVYSGFKVTRNALLSNAVNLTANATFRDDNNLILWVETSRIGKSVKNGGSVDIIQDLSKNLIKFEAASTKPTFKTDGLFDGIAALNFTGSNSLASFILDENDVKMNIAFNITSYTAFVVARPDSDSPTTGNIFNGGPIFRVSELSGNPIVVIKNDGTTKSIKRTNATKTFTTLTNIDSLNNRPTVMYIGDNGFKGEIYEIVIFDRILNEKEILEIEDYLYNKYNMR